ncbi:methyl farnesoate epoxidase-like [Linepithema humile]|uniref:methyl farnesoate epoxidase-like n=1 Tax=Linepithema humile TaxID=83485 RepID=UPI0006236FAA|nr:PREDICTED: probable cytochrome P450 303a1 [Linepithema humile]
MVVTAILLLVFILLLPYLDCRKPKGFPPGPRWWPILGCALEMTRIRREVKYMYKICLNLRDRYGPIVGLKIGKTRVIVANDLQSMQAILVNEDCDGRPAGILQKLRTSGVRRGIIMTDKQPWAEQRRFVTRHLREFGFSRTGMAALVEDEARELLEHLKKLLQDIGKSPKTSNKDNLNKLELHDKFSAVEDETLKHELRTAIKAEEVQRVSESREMIIEMVHIFDLNVLNSIWRMIVGKRFEIGDKKLERVQRILTKTLTEMDMLGSLFSYFPLLRFIIPETSGYKSFAEGHKELWDFVEEQMQYYKKTLDPNAPRGLMDVYLTALSSENRSDSFNESQLVAVCVDLFMAGTETTANSLTYAFLYLILFPRVQKKVQEELDRVIGRDRLPTMADKPKLMYLQVVVLECLRLFIAYSFSLPHRTLKDTTILGYKVPKNTMLMVNFNGVYDDKAYCDDFKNFRPERFFDKDGNIVTPDNYFPFGLGKRHCIGEMLARSNIFIIIATLLQNFSFSVVPGEPQPSTQDFIFGATPCPKPYKALISLRV